MDASWILLIILVALTMMVFGIYLLYDRKQEPEMTGLGERPSNPLSVENLPSRETLLEYSLYVHLMQDGRVFILPGATGISTWANHQQLQAELKQVRADGGYILFSREKPEEQISPAASENFKLIEEYNLPIQVVNEPHPEISG